MGTIGTLAVTRVAQGNLNRLRIKFKREMLLDIWTKLLRRRSIGTSKSSLLRRRGNSLNFFSKRSLTFFELFNSVIQLGFRRIEVTDMKQRLIRRRRGWWKRWSCRVTLLTKAALATVKELRARKKLTTGITTERNMTRITLSSQKRSGLHF